MKLLCPEILDYDTQESLENEGHTLSFDTRELLEFVELEQLSSEEILDIRSKLGVFEAYIQLKKVEYEKDKCVLYIYRVIILHTDFESFNPITQAIASRFSQMAPDLVTDPQVADFDSSGRILANPDFISNREEDEELDLQSVSTTSNASSSFNKMVQDFKKALGERKMPRDLVYMNRIIIIILLISFLVSGLEYYFLLNLLNDLQISNRFALLVESREALEIQLASNLRSLIDVANHLEDASYEGPYLVKIDRFTYLSRLVQSEADALKETED